MNIAQTMGVYRNNANFGEIVLGTNASVVTIMISSILNTVPATINDAAIFFVFFTCYFVFIMLICCGISYLKRV